MLNKVTLMGRLGKDPEVKYTPDGTAVANFSIATTESWKDKNSSEKHERTEWHRIVAWRKLGEICGKYLTKGKLIYCEGKIQTRSWEKDGQTHYATDIVIHEMKMLPDGNRDQNQGQRQGNSAGGSGQGRDDYRYPEPPPMDSSMEDDIPF